MNEEARKLIQNRQEWIDFMATRAGCTPNAVVGVVAVRDEKTGDIKLVSHSSYLEQVPLTPSQCLTIAAALAASTSRLYERLAELACLPFPVFALHMIQHVGGSEGESVQRAGYVQPDGRIDVQITKRDGPTPEE